ncbi:hypothetical protein TBLA_0C00980 [Henningerozyma blattae CBS 6284]|uniref:Uncharacterized protein n=1 Tax=Henningerozyma blattae (strain ATCC 34711 / CBS 6284 / DSM 70876 / NBRC 10599 / NRRL Y-10934 / UCD 77-7) TaxID=1071380 RepID=I2H0L1_HENB6|nr:hypothetical protein TBLA_0C00980 [Tetrapisispora blattae CBS 6284]CCH59913.1 hypothetical protein TBLA_0C00980 [Tetrapisispora blattae CBS 6284]
MSVSGLMRYGAELTIVAMLLAALRRESGVALAVNVGDAGWIIERWLLWGERCYDAFRRYAKRSSYFGKIGIVPKTGNLNEPAGNPTGFFVF